MEYITDATGIIKKKIKPNFKALGPKFGKIMKQVAGEIAQFNQEDIGQMEKEGKCKLQIADQTIELGLDDVEILTEDIPGWLVTSEGALTIALDINLSEELKQEGIAREFINKIQNLRKESNFEVTDRINLKIQRHEFFNLAVENFKNYISNQTLARDLILVDSINESAGNEVEIDQDVNALIQLEKTS